MGRCPGHWTQHILISCRILDNVEHYFLISAWVGCMLGSFCNWFFNLCQKKKKRVIWHWVDKCSTCCSNSIFSGPLNSVHIILVGTRGFKQMDELGINWHVDIKLACNIQVIVSYITIFNFGLLTFFKVDGLAWGCRLGEEFYLYLLTLHCKDVVELRINTNASD